MRILQIASGDFFSTYGGGQVYVKNIVDHFINKGEDICIISFVNISTPIKKDYQNKVLYEVPESIKEDELKVIIQSLEPDIIHTHSKKDISCRIGNKLNIPVIVTAHHGGILCPAGALLNNRDQICYKRASHQDCLPCVLRNTRTGLSFWYPLMKHIPKNKYLKLGTFLSNHKFIPFITPIGYGALHIQNKLNQWNDIINKADILIAPSKAVAEIMKINGASEDNIRIVPHGIPTILTKSGIPTSNGRRICFFYIGRICYIKGIHVLLKAFHSIIHQDIELHLIGSSGNKSENRYLRKLQDKYKKDSRIIWHGKLDHNRLFHLIENFHILIAPTICMEIFGLNIAESLAQGKPVLATRCGGAEMQIQDGINGWLIEPNDSEQLKTKIEEIIDNLSILPKMSKNCSAVSISEHYDSLMKIYKETINKATT